MKVLTVQFAGAIFAIAMLVGGSQASAADNARSSTAKSPVPSFKYEPDWPKQLPNAWVIGGVGAMFIDKKDHLWIAQRPASTSTVTERYALDGSGDCCAPAPPIMEFDPAGNLVQAWGPIHVAEPPPRPTPGAAPYAGPRRQMLVGKQVSAPYPDGVWPASEHGIFVDHKDNVWISSNAPPSQVVKFTRDGKFLMRIGTKEATSSNDKENLAGPTAVYVDPTSNEVFVSDGYRNRRVVVFDADTGKYKRHWGAYGKMPTDPQQDTAMGETKKLDQFSVTHCIVGDKDGLLYVCDRANSRIQVFKKDGTYVREAFVEPRKSGLGAVCGLAFSSDPEQRYVYVADPANKKVVILNRSDLKVVGSFGTGGREGGRLLEVHSLAVDSKGNVYTGEVVTNQRVQKFALVGGQ
jgi:hypothetical protein